MAEVSGPNFTIILILGTTSLSFLTYHTYRFDKCRCLIPRRKEWHRVLLTYLLFLSAIFLLVWAGGWAYVKYQLGWVRLGPWGARPWPSALFPPEYQGYNTPLTVCLNACYTLQAILTTQEAFYWYHLIRAVRHPQDAVPWLRSKLFKAWVATSVIIAVVQMSAAWVVHYSDFQVQISVELLTGASVEFIVLMAATAVVFQFPKFLNDVKASGAGPEVRSRLHFYHELNTVRTFFRYTFTLPLFILGGDGTTKAAVINLNAPATDILATTTVFSLVIVTMISIVLYLPRAAPSAAQNKVMVGQMPPHHAASGFALMSLLREGGQWEGLDDEDETDMAKAGERRGTDDAPFARAEARGPSWNLGGEEKWHGHGQARAQDSVPKLLEHFKSPIDVTDEPRGPRPVEIRMRVEKEVYAD